MEVTLPDYLLKLEAALLQMPLMRIQLPASDESSPQSLLHNSHSRFPLKYILSSPNLHLAYDSYILQGSLHKHHNILHRNYTAHTDSLPDVLLPDDGLPENVCVNELPVVLPDRDRDDGDDHDRDGRDHIRTLLHVHDGDDDHVPHGHDHGRGGHGRIRTLLHAHDGDDDARVPRGHDHGRGGHGHIHTLLHVHGDYAHDCEFLLLYVCCGFSQQLLHLVP